MKLAALGAVTVGVGVALGVPGLVGIGLFWMVMGLPARLHARRLATLRDTGPEGAAAPSPTPGRTPVVDGRTFALGTLLWLVLAVPSLAVGALEIGFGAEHDEWRWLPIVVGGLALGIGVVGAVLYLAGTALGATTDQPDIPAVVRIQALRETGVHINERPRLELDLLVEPDAGTGLAAYEVTKKATVPFTAMASLRVGGGFRALVAGPESPTTMEIHWDEPVPTTLDVSSRLDELDRLRRDGKVTDEEYQAQRQRILGSL